MTTPTFTVGQKVWFAPYNGTPGYVTVTKIKRGMITLDNDIEFWHWESCDEYGIPVSELDGGLYDTPIGRVFASEEAWIVYKAWNEFVNKIDRPTPPKGVTLKDIEMAAKVLGVTSDD